jgi:hypothetical protein
MNIHAHTALVPSRHRVRSPFLRRVNHVDPIFTQPAIFVRPALVANPCRIDAYQRHRPSFSFFGLRFRKKTQIRKKCIYLPHHNLDVPHDRKMAIFPTPFPGKKSKTESKRKRSNRPTPTVADTRENSMCHYPQTAPASITRT